MTAPVTTVAILPASYYDSSGVLQKIILFEQKSAIISMDHGILQE
jgi:hypothetical protein